MDSMSSSGSYLKREILSYSTQLVTTSREIYLQVLAVFDRLGECKEWIITHFGYAGFDIIAFRTLIHKKINSVEDLAFLIIMFLVRGNNVNRILESTNSKQVVSRLKKLVTLLHIKPKAAGRTQTVTLSRIAIVRAPQVQSCRHRMKPPWSERWRNARGASGARTSEKQPLKQSMLAIIHSNRSDIIVNSF